MDGISRSRGWDKEIPHGVLPMEQLVLSDKWARIYDSSLGTSTIPLLFSPCIGSNMDLCVRVMRSGKTQYSLLTYSD